MASKRDYYEILGVSKNATEDELKRSYRKLAMKYHPDRCKDPDAKDKFAEINEAYSVLSDKDKRARYDQFGFNGVDGNSGGFSSGFNPFEFFKSHFHGHSPFDDDMFNPFGFNFGSSNKSQNSQYDFDAPEDGADLQMKLHLTFDEALHGCIKDVELTLDQECPECKGRGIAVGSTPEKCSHCNGTGQVVYTQRNNFMMSQTISECPHCHGQGMLADICPHCNGQKRVPMKKKFSVKIPQGIADGQRLRLHGKGECGLKGGKDGDMYAYAIVSSSKLFSRQGSSINLETTVPVDAITASLGGTISVRTPWKTLKANVPIGTTSGTWIILKGQGVKTQSSMGDLYVTFSVEPFENLNDSQKKMLEDFKKSLKKENVHGLKEYESCKI